MKGIPWDYVILSTLACLCVNVWRRDCEVGRGTCVHVPLGLCRQSDQATSDDNIGTCVSMCLLIICGFKFFFWFNPLKLTCTLYFFGTFELIQLCSHLQIFALSSQFRDVSLLAKTLLLEACPMNNLRLSAERCCVSLIWFQVWSLSDISRFSDHRRVEIWVSWSFIFTYMNRG